VPKQQATRNIFTRHSVQPAPCQSLPDAFHAADRDGRTLKHNPLRERDLSSMQRLLAGMQLQTELPRGLRCS
jgi:hypothetical protein